jgi:nitronate monooxygenase
MENEAKAWKTVWSAGQGVGSIGDILPAAQLCAMLIDEYAEAMADVHRDAVAARPTASERRPREAPDTSQQ